MQSSRTQPMWSPASRQKAATGPKNAGPPNPRGSMDIAASWLAHPRVPSQTSQLFPCPTHGFHLQTDAFGGLWIPNSSPKASCFVLTPPAISCPFFLYVSCCITILHYSTFIIPIYYSYIYIIYIYIPMAMDNHPFIDDFPFKNLHLLGMPWDFTLIFRWFSGSQDPHSATMAALRGRLAPSSGRWDVGCNGTGPTARSTARWRRPWRGCPRSCRWRGTSTAKTGRFQGALAGNMSLYYT